MFIYIMVIVVLVVVVSVYDCNFISFCISVCTTKAAVGTTAASVSITTTTTILLLSLLSLLAKHNPGYLCACQLFILLCCL